MNDSTERLRIVRGDIAGFLSAASVDLPDMKRANAEGFAEIRRRNTRTKCSP